MITTIVIIILLINGIFTNIRVKSLKQDSINLKQLVTDLTSQVKIATSQTEWDRRAVNRLVDSNRELADRLASTQKALQKLKHDAMMNDGLITD